MKILLFGKTGMLGSFFLKYLSGAEGFDMYAFSREDFDITNYGELGKAFDRISPDFVLNCSAYTSVDDCETNEEAAFKVNAEAVGEIARLCKRAGAVLIHFSTDYVFDGKNEAGYKENDEPNPLNVYGKSKFEGEKLISGNMEKFYIIRTSWLFGENGKNFVNTMLELGKTKKELGVVGDQFGCPTYTKDLCEAIINNFIFNDDPLPFGIYHLTNSGPTTWFDFAVKIFELAELDVKVNKITSEEFPRPAKRPRHSILLNTKLDFSLRPWEDALDAYLALNPANNRKHLDV